MPIPLTRREVLAALLSAPALTLLGCGGPLGSSLPAEGEILGASHTMGHRLRAGFRPTLKSGPPEPRNVVIVGGGMAGLAAGWRLKALGITDFTILELEPEPGGTARYGASDLIAYPWGAHYVPAPSRQDRALIQLLDELGILEGTDADGEPIVAEQHLCRDPEERLFHNGAWQKGLYPYDGASADDLAQLRRFEEEIARWVAWRDSAGRRAFAIPMAACSPDPEPAALDKLSMAQWLDERQFTSTRLRWLVNYSCQDDYGLTIDQASAWAGVFYFASRVPASGEKSQPLVTFPEGNGRFVRYLREQLADNIRSGMLVTEIGAAAARDSRRNVIAAPREGDATVYAAGSVILAAPQFLTPHLIADLPPERQQAAAEFTYGSWLVANLHLKNRPAEHNFPLAWDNVLYESSSLGYVVATHQKNMEYGPTVFTYYYPFCDADPAAARQKLLDLSWSECAELALADLQTAHPDIRELTTRLDVMKWGHAMIRPVPGFRTSASRELASQPLPGIHFANTDLSGVALLEEALHHGVRAAEEISTGRGMTFASLL